MKKCNLVLIFSILVLLPGGLRAQTVIRIVDDYVLVDTDIGIGSLREVIPIYRNIDNAAVTIGQMRIVAFREGLAALKVVSLEPGFQVSRGDFVRVKALDTLTEEKTRINPRTKTTSRGIRKPVLGVHFGSFLPSSHLENALASSFSLGLSVKLWDANRHHFYVDATYPIFKSKISGVELHPSSLYIFNILDHIRLGERIHFDIGGGLYLLSGSDTSMGQSDSETGARSGFFMGLSLDFLNLSGWLFSPRVRYHAYRSNDNWNEFALGGINVYFSLF